MIERRLCTAFELYTNSFCRQRARFKVLIKVTLKADRRKKSEKSFTKKLFFIVFFSITKNVFHYMFAKFYLPHLGACNLQPAVLNLRHMRKALDTFALRLL